MRRADRLFQLLVELGRNRVRTARELGERLGVSARTVYRDIDDLVARGAPIEGAAGVGYALRAGYSVPPMMFDAEELEALALGAAWVSAYADDHLQAAAERALSKVDAVLPDRLKPQLRADGLEVLGFRHRPATRAHLALARRASREKRKLLARYRDAHEELTERRLWPLGLFYWGGVWTLAAWCELRGDYRSFRVDRFESLQQLDTPIPSNAAVSLQAFLSRCQAEAA